MAFGLVLAAAIGCGELLKLAEHPSGSTAFDTSVTTWVVAHRAAGLTTAARLLSTVGSQAVLAPFAGVLAVDVGHSSAFPSGHATQSLATFLALAVVTEAWLSSRRWPGRLAAGVLAAAVGWSRVYLGVHWTTDVVAGWLIAVAWIAMVTSLAAGARQPPRTERPRATPPVCG